MPSSEQKKILVVDDDLVTRKTLVKILKNSGYTMIQADNGSIAIDMFNEHTPDLVLMDVIMPIMDGYEACKRLRTIADYQNLPILMLTGLSDIESVDKAFDAGATDFITKPINWSLLEQRVRYAIRATEMHKTLQSHQAKLTQAQRIAKLGYWEMDIDSDDIRCSIELLDLLKLAKTYEHQPLDKFLKLIHPDDIDIFKQTFSQAINNALPFQIEHRLIRHDGVEMYVQQQTEIISDANGKAASIIGTLQDISELKSTEELVTHQRYFDSLTDLPNRKHFIERAKKIIELPEHSEELIATCLVSIDKLKNINETLGHDVADEIILAYTQRLKTISIGNISLSRYHDDTFGLFVTGLKGFNHVNELLQQIMSINNKPVWLEENELHIQTSIGLSLYPLDNDDFDTILKGAQNALNRAREKGGNQSVFYSEKMNLEAHNRLEMERDMRKGLEQGEFITYYQPQVNTKTGMVCGMEALVRWQHPIKGLVSPFFFIPVAEDTGLIKQLGAIVLKDSCIQTKKWHDEGLGDLRVGVNLSAVQISDAGFYDEVISILEESQLLPSLLDLEITESMVVHDIDNVISVLNKFQEKGISISMDDFGTGYSALSLMQQLPIDILKIDRSFIKDIGFGDNGAIAGAIIAMSHSLGLSVIAEGVETEDQRDFVSNYSCDEIQGFYYSQPLPADEFEAFVIKHNSQIANDKAG